MSSSIGNSRAGARKVPALRFSGVSFRHRPEAPLALSGVNLELEAGEILALVGGNGSGKTTLARLTNGLLLPGEGDVQVEGMSTTDPARLWDIRSRVGLLFQNPDDQIVGASVEDDIAFGLENLGLPREEMRRRVSEAVARVGLAGQEGREPHLLSGGQKQRLALAAVLALRPSILVLDEPTSMLDPSGREEILAFVQELASQGVAVLLITQHMEETLLADRLIYLEKGRPEYEGQPSDFFRSGRFRDTPLGPPRPMALAEEIIPGRAAPLTEEELLRQLVETLAPGVTVGDGQVGEHHVGPDARTGEAGADSSGRLADLPAVRSPGPVKDSGPVAGGVTPIEGRPSSAISLARVGLTYAPGLPLEHSALEDVNLELPGGTVVAVLGATAAGKSSLLQLMAGLLPPTEGEVRVLGKARPAPGQVGMAFQRPEFQLFAATVAEDVAVAPRMQGLTGLALHERVRWAMGLAGLDPAVFEGRAPFTLSLGEQRRAALAGILSLDPQVLILDEPGAGLDPEMRRLLLGRLLAWARGASPGSKEGPQSVARGGRRTLIFTSHDLDEVAEAADLVVLLAEGRLLALGPVELLGDEALLAGAGLHPPLAARLARGLAVHLALPLERIPVRTAGLACMLREQAAGVRE